LKCDGTRSETRLRLLAKWTSPFKSAEALVQSTAGSRGACISGSNAGYTTFRGSVRSTGYPLHSPFSPSLPLPRITVCHHVSTGLKQHSLFGFCFCISRTPVQHCLIFNCVPTATAGNYHIYLKSNNANSEHKFISLTLFQHNVLVSNHWYCWM